MPVTVPSNDAFIRLVATVEELRAVVDELSVRIGDIEELLDFGAPTDPDPDPEPEPEMLTDLAATTDGSHVVLSWSGHDTVHLTADDIDSDGDIVRTTDQGVVTGSPQRRGPMGRLDWSYRFHARQVVDDEPTGQWFTFPTASFPPPAPEPTPPPPATGGRLLARVPLDGSTADPFDGFRRGDSGIRQWSSSGPNTFALGTFAGQTFGRARITGGPHGADIRAEGIVADSSGGTLKLRDGDIAWFGGTIAVNSAFPDQFFNNVVQWKNDGTGSAPMFLGAWDGRMQLRSSFGNRAVGALDKGRPHRYVFGVRFGADGTGWVEAWRDGVRTLDRTPASTLRRGVESYYKIGYYRGRATAGTGEVWHRDHRIGTTRESVE